MRLGLAQVVLSPGARAQLLNYGWPGNVRELEHAIHRAVVLARATRAGEEVVLEAHHFAFSDDVAAFATAAIDAPVNDAALNLRTATEDFQRQLIENALRAHDHNWAASARALEMDVANLHRLAKRLGLKG